MKKIIIFLMAFMVSFVPYTVKASDSYVIDFSEMEDLTDESIIQELNDIEYYANNVHHFGVSDGDYTGSYISYNNGNGVTQKYYSDLVLGEYYIVDDSPTSFDGMYLYDTVDIKEGFGVESSIKFLFNLNFNETDKFDPSSDELPESWYLYPTVINFYIKYFDTEANETFKRYSIATDSCTIDDDGYMTCNFELKNFGGFGFQAYYHLANFEPVIGSGTQGSTCGFGTSRICTTELAFEINDFYLKSINDDESVGLLEGLIDWVKGIYNAITGNDDVTSDKVDEVIGSNQELIDKSDQLSNIENDLTNQFDSAIGNINTDLDLLDVSDFVSSAQFLSVNMSRIVSSNNYIQYMITFSLVLGFALVLIGRGLK